MTINIENNSMNQKEVFLQSEGDAWFIRNHEVVAEEKDFSQEDSVTQAVIEITKFKRQENHKKIKILEVGCGEGRRLSWLKKNIHVEVYGIEPSAKAVALACKNGITAQRGTADKLPFEEGSFDILIFGFCLYLCDPSDLFKIAQEADRVLKNNAWLVINDFYSVSQTKRQYHHKPGIYSYKMDYRTLFDWHPDYVCFSHRVEEHGKTSFTDEVQEWVATSVMRKKLTSYA